MTEEICGYVPLDESSARLAVSWRFAKTLATFESELNRAYPKRDKTSDGKLGNLSHQATKSDHNPDSRGVVCAFDVDEDLLGPTDAYPSFHSGRAAAPLVAEILKLARAGKLPQLYYLIYEGKIYSRTYGFRERKYEGASPHDHHFHLSVYHDAKHADSTKPWGIGEDVALSDSDLDKIEARLLKPANLNKIADAVLDRDGKIPSGNSENPFVAIKTALGRILNK